MSDIAERLRVAERAARAGGDVAATGYRDGIEVETKGGKTDVVTQADRDAQRRVIEVVREEYPDDAVVGEEENELKEVPERGAAWVVDPIDGTNNFVRDLPLWATSVAAVVDGEPVGAANHLPALGDTYVAGAERTTMNGDPVSVSDVSDPKEGVVVPTIWWDFDRRDEYAACLRACVERFGDMRRFGSAQAVLSFVAAGQVDAAITNVAPNPWDSVAGVHLVRRAGGRVTDLDGERWRHDSQGMVASNGDCHDAALAAARAAEDVRVGRGGR